MRGAIVTILLLFCVGITTAQERGSVVIDGHAYDYSYTPIDQSYNPMGDGGSGRSFLSPIPVGQDGYLSFLVIPAYTLETNFMLGAAATYTKYVAEQRVCDVSLSASGSISGHYSVAVAGQNYLTAGRNHRLTYGADILSTPSRIWGLDYSSALASAYQKYTKKEYSAWLRYTLALGRFVAGAYVDYRYVAAANLDDAAWHIFANQQLCVSTAGVGLSLAYDSRKSPAYTRGRYSGGVRGIYAMIESVYRPNALSNIAEDVVNLRALFDYYQPLWQGGMLALDIYGEACSAQTPWLLMPQLGGDSRMRGYYAGRFRGNRLVSAQLELRQHIWNGIGAVAWGGAGMALSSDETFHWRRVLPTYGAGLRYSYEQLTLRLDVAFGRGSNAIILGLNEAF